MQNKRMPLQRIQTKRRNSTRIPKHNSIRKSEEKTKKCVAETVRNVDGEKTAKKQTKKKKMKKNKVDEKMRVIRNGDKHK
jgi:hypothetical protein